MSVIREHDFDSCKGTLKQTTYFYRGYRLTTLTTFEDNCDGGNVYGILKTARGKTLAHIYDGDFYCPPEWR